MAEFCVPSKPNNPSPTSKRFLRARNEKFFDTHHEEILRLEKKFAGYWAEIDRHSIRRWLRQFGREDRGLALKLLNKVDYYSPQRVVRELRQLHGQLLELKGGILGQTFFASFTPPGKSGDEILARYRLASELRGSQHDEMFLHLSSLYNRLVDVTGLGNYVEKEVDTFVLVDDFVGTGDQAIGSWINIEGFLTGVEEVFLSVLVGHEEGIQKIERETRLKVITNRRLPDETKIFSPSNRTFTTDEKRVLRDYCKRVGDMPNGYGGCQSLVVFCHRVSDNTISILRSDTPQWRGLFLRY